MTALIQSRDPAIALATPRATLYRHLKPKWAKPALRRHVSPPRLSESERQVVLDVLHEPLFIDQPPAEVYTRLLEEGRHLCSIRTMYRLLAEAGECGERRAICPKTRPYAVPRFIALAPNDVWIRDIHKARHTKSWSLSEPVCGARSLHPLRRGFDGGRAGE